MSNTASVLVFKEYCHVCPVPPMHCEKKRATLLAMSDAKLGLLQKYLVYGHDQLQDFPEGVEIATYIVTQYFRGKLEKGLTILLNNQPVYLLSQEGRIIRQAYGIPSMCPAMEKDGTSTATEITYTPTEP